MGRWSTFFIFLEVFTRAVRHISVHPICMIGELDEVFVCYIFYKLIVELL